MIRPLRKRHLQIWSLWALLLPLGIISATVSRKPLPTDRFAQREQQLLPVVLATKTWNGNVVELRSADKAAVQQLVWVNKKPLAVPTATLYVASSATAGIKAARYIGRIETRGDYAFDLELPANRPVHLIVYDFIHQQEIGRIAF